MAAKTRNVHLWLPAYLKRDWAGARERKNANTDSPLHVMFCVADHFEPALGRPGIETERRRVAHWMERYPLAASRFLDADGRPPRHSFFYPAEDYRPEHLDALAELAGKGLGEVEVHLHHDNDTSEGLRAKLEAFKQQLRRHALLGSDPATGEVRYGFVHGNWALDNSLPGGRWCGVDDELTVLRDTGCYADFTLPSAPSASQTRRINSIYYAKDDPARPKSHDDGREARVGQPADEGLLIVQGPLGVRWTGGRMGLLPRVENANLAGNAPGTPKRVAAWLNTRVTVSGKPDWVFIKVHTHGCNEKNWSALFGEGMERMHRALQALCNDGGGAELHYVTAREMYNIAKAAECGFSGNPNAFRDFAVLPPPAAGATAATPICEEVTRDPAPINS